MFDILERILSVDPLAIAVLVGSILFLWAIWRVLLDDVDFGERDGEQSKEQPENERPEASTHPTPSRKPRRP